LQVRSFLAYLFYKEEPVYVYLNNSGTTDFYRSWYKYHATGGHANLESLNFLPANL